MFTAQLEKSRNATNLANARSIYAQLVADYLDDNSYNDSLSSTAWSGSAGSITVGTQVYKFQPVSGASLTITTGTAAPVVEYKGLGGTETFGAAS